MKAKEMLDGIINIKTDKDFIGQKKNLYQQKYLQGEYISEKHVKDHLSFSPLARYISKLNWDLREVKFLKDNKIFLNFLLSDIEFVTEIDITNFLKVPEQKYKLLKTMEHEDVKIRFIVDLFAKKEISDLISENYKFYWEEINSLFEKLYEFKTRLKIEYFDDRMSKQIVKEVTEKFYPQINYINNLLYVFLQKVKISKEPDKISSKDGIKNLAIEKITIFCSEENG